MPEEHQVKCLYCGLSWRTADQSPTLYCRKCNRQFPNPWAPAKVKG